MSEQQQPLLSTASHEPVKLMGLGRLASARQTVRHHVRRNRTLIVTIQLLTLSLYVVGMFAAHKHAHDVQPVEEGHGLEKRTILNGHACEHRRSQLGVFMAAFFGGMFAADQWFARNFQLAIPKFIYMFCGGLIGFEIVILGFSAGFAWWLCDVVMWGIGFYTTHTYWSNPTRGCAVRGW